MYKLETRTYDRHRQMEGKSGPGDPSRLGSRNRNVRASELLPDARDRAKAADLQQARGR